MEDSNNVSSELSSIEKEKSKTEFNASLQEYRQRQKQLYKHRVTSEDPQIGTPLRGPSASPLGTTSSVVVPKVTSIDISGTPARKQTDEVRTISSSPLARETSAHPFSSDPHATQVKTAAPQRPHTPPTTATSHTTSYTPSHAKPLYQGQSTPSHAKPLYQGQSTPLHAKPSTPSHAKPLYQGQSTPSHAKPSTPSHAKPLYQGQSTPSHAKPSTPSHAKPSTPSHAKPSTPLHAKPKTLASSTPSTSSYPRSPYTSGPPPDCVRPAEYLTGVEAQLRQEQIDREIAKKLQVEEDQRFSEIGRRNERKPDNQYVDQLIGGNNEAGRERDLGFSIPALDWSCPMLNFRVGGVDANSPNQSTHNNAVFEDSKSNDDDENEALQKAIEKSLNKF